MPEVASAHYGLLDELRRELSRVIDGQEKVLVELTVALAAGGHVLLEGVPGVAKTLIARSLSAAVDARFSRIQFTPDLMPADITGVNIFEPKTGDFRFRPGPLFADIVVADEINRAPAKTQAALLEAMQEGQVSIDGTTHSLSPVLMVVATQNPIEYEGTYPLPEAQLDRFLMKLIVEYPNQEEERAMIGRMNRIGEDARRPEKVIKPVADVATLMKARSAVYGVEADESVVNYVVDIVRRSRNLKTLTLGASPRSAVMLLTAAKALALTRQRSYVTPDEVRDIALSVLRHRVRLTPEAEIEGLTADVCLQSLLKDTPVPR